MSTTIPLDNDDVTKLTQLAFAWDLTPQEALRRCLDAGIESLSAEGCLLDGDRTLS